MIKEASLKSDRTIAVAELFAGVGGFRIGLERASKDFTVVWSNQWEPNKKNQFASDIYIRRFGNNNHLNQDIATVSTDTIPEFDMLVGGFPCQDYSVARTLNQSTGIMGKKGVLWWEIHRILQERKSKVQYAFLENVDRLLKSPASQRGRDFAIMLASLADLGYIVEWRVINSADYGMPQRRRRVYFLAYNKSSVIHKKIRELKNPQLWVLKEGVMAKAFEVKCDDKETTESFPLEGSLSDLTDKFNKAGKQSPFENSGIMIDRNVWTFDVEPIYAGPRTLLKDIILPEDKVPEEFFIDKKTLKAWEYMKGAKNETRTHKKSGTQYSYTEGKMVFPDSLDKPSRTIVTGEGGSSASRFKHVIKTKSGKLRRLMPLELERLNMFPDHHTKETSDINRAFLMGNALVVGVVEKIGASLASQVRK